MSTSVPPEVFNKALDGIVDHERSVAGEAITATDIEPHRHPESLGIQPTKKRKFEFECRLLGAERKSIPGDWMSVHSQERKSGCAKMRAIPHIAILAELTSDDVLDTAYDWLCRRRRAYPADADVWSLRQA